MNDTVVNADAHEAGEQLKDFIDAGGTLLDTAAAMAMTSAPDLVGGEQAAAPVT